MRLLLIEDAADLADAIMARLVRVGYAVSHVADGEDAAALLATEPFDLVLLDINLPRKEGGKLLRELRMRKNRTPVLVITARAGVEDRIAFLDLGADDYLVKPFDLGELEARVRALLRRPMGMSASAETYGNLDFDAAARQVRVEGKPVDLSRREFRLLEILIGQIGRLVLKERLLDQLFGPDDEVAPNAVELYVSRLRRKLAVSDLDIATLRGEGYLARLRTDGLGKP
jgi:two-component system response regulator TctD